MPSRKMLVLLSAILVMGFVSVLIVLSMLGGVDNYTPTTDAPAVIFQQACARCHGEKGLGDDGIGPRLAGQREEMAEVLERVQEGHGRMPRFPNIRGRALENLAAYVHDL